MATWTLQPGAWHTSGETALIKAVIQRNYNEIYRQIESGADVNETDSDGRTALHFAAQSGFCLSPLLQAGCDVDILPNDGNSALSIAAIEGRCNVIKSLCQAGANTNTKNQYRVSPAYTLCVKGHVGCLDYLFRHGAHYEESFIVAAGLHMRYNVGLYLILHFGVVERVPNAGRLIRMWHQTNHDKLQISMLEELCRCLYELGYITNPDKNLYSLTDNRSSFRTLKQISRMVVRSYLPSIVQYSVYDSLPLPTGLKTYLAGGDFTVQLTGAEGNVYLTEDVN